MEHLQIKEYLQWQRPMQSSEWGQKIKTPVEDKNKQIRSNFIGTISFGSRIVRDYQFFQTRLKNTDWRMVWDEFCTQIH